MRRGDGPAHARAATLHIATAFGDRAVSFLAIGYGPDMEYGVFKVAAVAEGSGARVGERLVVATALADDLAKTAGITEWRQLYTLPGARLADTRCAHVSSARKEMKGESATSAPKLTTNVTIATHRHSAATRTPTCLSSGSLSSVPAVSAIRLTASPETSVSPLTPCAGMKRST